MARFKIVKSETKPPHMIFDVELISGVLTVGGSFSLWDTHHRFDFQIAEFNQHGREARLLCTSDYLKNLSPEERLADIFAMKEVDTEDVKVAQSNSHKWISR